MPPTGRRRKNKEPEQRADADAAEAATPSRKRRRVNGPNNGKAAATTDRASRERSVASDVTVENSEEEALRQLAAMIPRLRTAHYQVAVATDYNNTIMPTHESAFAKIAGRNWTYYVKTTVVNIGRPNSKPKRESVPPGSLAGETGTPTTERDNMRIHIDLGPDQQISRMHAEISYDAEKEIWLIRCNGRNGLHLDDMRVERGMVCSLHSGAILSILGTQMIFVLPKEAPEFHPAIKAQIFADADAEDEQYEQGDGKPTGTNARYGGQPPSGAYQPGDFSRNAGSTGSGTQAAQVLAALSSSRDPPGTPRLPPPQPKSKNSPAYAVKGVMIESTEEVDYSADSAKDFKPPHSYAQMIGQAIMSREGENATLAQIYEFIKDNYAYFRHGGGGWQNSIRHNLSLSKHFEKIPRRTDEPGKGMKWQIVPEFRDEYMKKNFHESRRPVQRRLDSSGPNSPAAPMGQTQRLMGALDADQTYIKRHSGSPTPPRHHAHPLPNESFTPDRGPRLQTHRLPMPANGAVNPTSATSELVTPTFERNNPLASQQTFSAGSHHSQGLAVDSPPGLHPGMSNNENTVAHGIIHTPLPARSAPPKAFPSTIKPPSFYAKELFSSPAPFWKYADVVGSTPLRPMPDLSPEKFAKPILPGEDEEIKSEGEEEEEEDEKVEMLDEDEDGVEKKEEDQDAKPDLEDVEQVTGNDLAKDLDGEPQANDAELPPPPSSPLGNLKKTTPEDEGEEAAPDESPTRTVSRPVSRREPIAAPTNGTVNGAIPKLAPPPAQPKFNLQAGVGRGGFGMGLGLYRSGGGHQRGGSFAAEEDEEDEGIDLSKTSFQKIGQYHRVMNAARPAVGPRQ